MKINAEKTKYLCLRGGEECTRCEMELNGVNLEQMNEFVYLESMFEGEDCIDGEKMLD